MKVLDEVSSGNNASGDVVDYNKARGQHTRIEILTQANCRRQNFLGQVLYDDSEWWYVEET